MKQKFTYSRKDKARPRNNEDATPDDEDGSRKRRKTDSPSETSSFVSVPTISSTASSIRAKGSAIFKRTSQLFTAPNSVSHDDGGVDVTPKSRKSLAGLFDKALQPRNTHPAKVKQPNVHGSREEFVRTIEVRKKETHVTQLSGSYLPTPPSEVQKLRSNGTACITMDAAGSRSKTDTALGQIGGPKEATELCRRRSKSKAQKQIYVPKPYAARRTKHAGVDLFGDRLLRRSREVQLWSTNQAKSPFLRLPDAVRAQIYSYVLGGKTINIAYETYRPVKNTSGPDRVVPIFRYSCAVYSQPNVNPFRKQQLPYLNVTYGYTVLNNVCRQLYNETATLPYTLNTLAFSSHNVLFNFIFLEQRLSREQREAITSITVHDALPMPNLLVYLRNLQRVVLVDDLPGNSKGTYKVTRVKGKAPKLLNTRHVWGG